MLTEKKGYVSVEYTDSIGAYFDLAGNTHNPRNFRNVSAQP